MEPARPYSTPQELRSRTWASKKRTWIGAGVLVVCMLFTAWFIPASEDLFPYVQPWLQFLGFLPTALSFYFVFLSLGSTLIYRIHDKMNSTTPARIANTRFWSLFVMKEYIDDDDPPADYWEKRAVGPDWQESSGFKIMRSIQYIVIGVVVLLAILGLIL